jgi:hypothetical protein
MQNSLLVAFIALVVLAGCATTKVETIGPQLAKPICQLEEKPAIPHIGTILHFLNT